MRVLKENIKTKPAQAYVVGGWVGLTLNQSRKETVARQGELQLHKRVGVHHRM